MHAAVQGALSRLRSKQKSGIVLVQSEQAGKRQSVFGTARAAEQRGGVIMALPKKKVSKARRNSRRANWKLSLPGVVECPKCKEPKLAHRVCKSCGYYDGQQVIQTEESK